MPLRILPPPMRMDTHSCRYTAVAADGDEVRLATPKAAVQRIVTAHVHACLSRLLLQRHHEAINLIVYALDDS